MKTISVIKILLFAFVVGCSDSNVQDESFSLLGLNDLPVVDANWTNIVEPSFAFSEGYEVVAKDGKVYFYGGYEKDYSGRSRQGWTYGPVRVLDSEQLSWSKLGSIDYTTVDHTLNVIDDVLYTSCGQQYHTAPNGTWISQTFFGNVRAFDANTTNGRSTPRNGLKGRVKHTSVVHGNKLVIWGGRDINRNLLGDGAILDTSDNEWKKLPTLNSPSPRSNHFSIVLQNKMVIFGGVIYGFDRRGGIYDFQTNSWKKFEVPVPFGTSRDNKTQAIAIGSKIYVWGKTRAVYDLYEDKWQDYTFYSEKLAILKNSTMGAIGTNLIFVGSYNRNYDLGVGFCYNTQTNTWSTIKGDFDSRRIGNTRSRPSAHSSNDSLVFWGGTSNRSGEAVLGGKRLKLKAPGCP